jgi:putative flippase GtrA
MKIKSMLSNPRERERFIKFSVVGAFGAVVDFGSFHLLISLLEMRLDQAQLQAQISLLGMRLEQAQLQAMIAQACSFSLAVTSNFIWNRLWTYPDSRSKSISGQLLSFFTVNLVGLAIRTPIFASLEGPFRRLFEGFAFLPLGWITADRLGYTFALGVAVVVVMFWNFFINRVWTYNDVE